MRDNFPEPILDPEIDRFEGGYVDHPRDPGGATNRGVTQRTLDRYCDLRGVPRYDVRDLDDDHRHAIYRDMYWDVAHGDEWPAGLDLVVMDAAVNSGPRRGVRWAQEAMEARPFDGRWGPVTSAAVGRLFEDGAGEIAAVIREAVSRRRQFLRGLPHWDTFKRGWTRRVDRVESRGLEMARARANTVRDTGAGGAGTGVVTVDQTTSGLPYWLVAGTLLVVASILLWNHRAALTGAVVSLGRWFGDLRRSGFNPAVMVSERREIAAAAGAAAILPGEDKHG